MNHFSFALNSTAPIFLVILAGWLLRRLRILDEGFCKAANRYVFSCALPVSLFQSIAKMDVGADFDARFCLFCLAATTVMFLGTWGLSWRLIRKKRLIGAFSQAAVRSSAAIFGVAFAVSIYGDAGITPLMILVAVPFFNIYSVLILTFSPPALPDAQSSGPQRSALKRACVSVAKNPIILGVLIGLPFALLRVRVPALVDSALSMLGGTASPVALLVIGASFSGEEAIAEWKLSAAASLIKLFLLPLVFLPVAVLLGFRNSALVAFLIMVGSPTTVAGYVMAKSMNADGALTSSVVLLTTLLASVSLTLWLFILRSFALI